MFKINVIFEREDKSKEKAFELALDRYYRTWGKANKMTRKECRMALENNPGLVKSCLVGIVG